MESEVPFSILASTLGAIELGYLLGAVLLGTFFVQTWYYYAEFGDDPMWLKIVVAFILIFEVVSSALSFYTIFYYTVITYGNFVAVESFHWTSSLAYLFSVFNIFITQAFYTFRIWTLTKSRIIVITISILATLRFGFGIATTAFTILVPAFETIKERFAWAVTSVLTVGAAADVLIAVTLCTTFWRRRTGIVQTNKILDKLVAFAIGTGLVTSVVTVAELITFSTMDNLVWCMFLLILMQLFPNSLLASLNERSSIRKDIQNVSMLRSTQTARRGLAAPRSRSDQVVIELTTEISGDLEVGSGGRRGGVDSTSESEFEGKTVVIDVGGRPFARE